MSNEPTGDVNNLMAAAVKQCEDHKKWLAEEIRAMPADVPLMGAREVLAMQAGQIKVRLVNVNNNRVNIVYDYPDELLLFLQSEHATPELRASVAGGHVVDPSKPALTFHREQ